MHIDRCENCGYDKIEITNKEVGYFCPRCGRDTEKLAKEHQTNFDRIHSMSVEELAKEIAEKIECTECPFNGDEEKCGNIGCSELFLGWLQSEVEG